MQSNYASTFHFIQKNTALQIQIYLHYKEADTQKDYSIIDLLICQFSLIHMHINATFKKPQEK